MNDAERIRNEKLGASLIKALALRHFEAYYCASSSEAAEKILSLIPKTDVVSWGGSMTMEALGVIDRVKKAAGASSTAARRSRRKRKSKSRGALFYAIRI